MRTVPLKIQPLKNGFCKCWCKNAIKMEKNLRLLFLDCLILKKIKILREFHYMLKLMVEQFYDSIYFFFLKIIFSSSLNN